MPPSSQVGDTHLMNGALTLTLAALVYLILAAMVMDLFMELIAQLLQSRTTSDSKEDLNSRRPAPSQDEQLQETPSAPAPGTQQDDDPRPPPVSGPPDPIPLLAYGLSTLGYPVLELEIQEMIRRIDFSDVLMTWFLPALLFAGALHVNLDDLRSYKWPITFLATGGVLIATFVVAGLAYYTFALFGRQ